MHDTRDAAPLSPAAARRYEQLRQFNIPSAAAERLARHTWGPFDCVAGTTPGPPDFIGIGAMKAGTTWWHTLLTQHPRMYLARPRKETHFFDFLIGMPFGAEQIAEYHQLFCRPAGMMSGEWTPRYASDFWVPRALKAAAPDAKLLMMVRDPVDRFISGVTHQVTREVLPKTAIVDLWPTHFARGLYYQQISRYLRVFPREQLLVLQYERCAVDPLGELKRTFAFLGLEMPDDLTENDVRQRHNRTKSGKKIVLPPHVRAALIENYQDDVTQLMRAYPDIHVELWPHFKELA